MWVAPSLLSCDFSCLREEIEDVVRGGADLLHLDVMDGHFVPNLTFGPMIVKAIRKLTRLPLDAHLMIENPEKWVDRFIEAGADWISFHFEACRDPISLAKYLKEKKIKAGLAINPGTPFESVKDILREFDFILVMTVNPGFGGQRFMKEVVEKIERIHSYLGGEIPIEVDGGINAETVEYVLKAGATIIVSGSYIFGSPDRKYAIDSLRRENGDKGKA
ncbi:ribulose-phosphate 3-epimerase [bacterium]|nr:MAG: ribulose-phosphate 3-epimerase [bacterium]